MTMHILPAYYTTTSLKKRKNKNKTASLVAAEKEHAEFLKKMGVKPASGAKEVGVATRSRFDPKSEISTNKSETKIDFQKTFYHHSMAKKEPKVYTGTEIIGIAQMHKSNLVPIRNKKSAEEISKMRRG